MLLNFSHCSNTSKGFTLIELLIALSVMYILTSVAIPSMANTISNVRQTGNLNVLFSHLQLTRTKAIFSNQNLLMCKSKRLKQCESEAEWSDGWIVFADSNFNKQKDENEELVFKQHRLKSIHKIVYNSFAGGSDFVLFYAKGFSYTNGTFIFCHEKQVDQSQAIIISRTGRIRTSNQLSDSNISKC